MKKKEAAKGTEDQEKIVDLMPLLSGEAIQGLLEERAKRAALSFGLELLELEVERLCGARYSRQGICSRHGHEGTSIIIGGARYEVTRPRVRGDSGEVSLETLGKLRQTDLLDEQMKQRMLRGVSSRNYEEVIEGYGEKVGVSKSSVSRAFVRASQRDLDDINGADLSAHSFVALVIDGLELDGTTVVAALGVTTDMEKIPLGLKEGSTENAQVVGDLLANLTDRSFSFKSAQLLCVLDGSKALKKAVRNAFGERAIIQRCWLHKMRNIEGYIPKHAHGELHRRMRKLMGLSSLKEAKTEYKALHRWLKGISHEAANSLDEAGGELLTLHALGITGELRKSLSSTNLIESLFSVVRRKLANVKNWKGRKSAQKLRWCASAIAQHRSTGMRRLRGKSDAAKLIDALNNQLETFALAA